jgi:hypothetical protein
VTLAAPDAAAGLRKSLAADLAIAELFPDLDKTLVSCVEEYLACKAWRDSERFKYEDTHPSEKRYYPDIHIAWVKTMWPSEGNQDKHRDATDVLLGVPPPLPPNTFEFRFPKPTRKEAPDGSQR